jgi:hypothetical protein
MSNISHPRKPSAAESSPRGVPPWMQEWAFRGAKPRFASSSLTYSAVRPKRECVGCRHRFSITSDLPVLAVRTIRRSKDSWTSW